MEEGLTEDSSSDVFLTLRGVDEEVVVASAKRVLAIMDPHSFGVCPE